MRWIILTLTLALGLVLGCSSPDKASEAKTKTPEAKTKTSAAKPGTPTALPSAAKAAPPKAAQKPAEINVADGDSQHEDDDVLAQLVGIWRVDLDALAKDSSIAKLAEKDRPDALALMKQTFQSMAFEYAADGKMRVFMGSQVRSGTYRIDETTDDGVKITTVLGKGAAKIETKSKISFLGGTAVIEEEGQPTLRLLRGIPTPPGAQPPQ